MLQKGIRKLAEFLVADIYVLVVENYDQLHVNKLQKQVVNTFFKTVLLISDDSIFIK